MLIDLHNHTSALSDDSLITPEELIEGAKKAGLDGVCITEHDYFWDHDELSKIGRKMDFLVIPGIEINTEEGHLLVFGLDEYVFGMHRASFVKDKLDKKGGAMVVAHPYRRRFRPEYDGAAAYESMLTRAFDNTIFSVVDGVEVNNGRGSNQENAFAQELTRRLNLKGVAASDAHQIHDIGKNATRFERRITGLEDLITELKAGRFRPEPLR
jgi:predicted metal-dependent phosphoesterase TrpH